MAESLKYFRQKKGTWIWVYDMETNRRKKLELQLRLGDVVLYIDKKEEQQ